MSAVKKDVVEQVLADAVKVSDVQRAIRTGELDAYLEDVVRSVKARRNAIAAEAVKELEVGDVVVLQGMRPRYVNGMRGTVKSKVQYNRKGERMLLVDVPQLVGTPYRRLCKVRPT